jgi:ABC-2 type transport system permease protein
MVTLIAIVAIWQKELRMMSRRAAVIVFLLIMPLMLIVITSDAFGFVLGESGLGVVAVDLDGSPRSTALIAELRETQGIDLHVEQWQGGRFERSDAEQLLGDVDGSAVFVVPPGFGGGGNSGLPTLYVDPVQAGLSAIVRDRVERVIAAEEITRSVPRTVAALAGGVADSELQAAVVRALDEPPVNVETVSTAERQAFPSAFEQSVPGFAVMFSLYIAAYVALFIYYEKGEWGTWRRTLVAPVPAWAALGARLLAYTGVGILQTGVLLALGWAVWDLSLGNSPVALLLTMTSAALVSVGLGLFVSVYIGRSLQLQASLITLTLFALGVIGGAMVPVFLLPDWMQFVSRATPHFWTLNAFQDIMIRGHGVLDVLPSLGIVLAFAAALFAGALARFRFVD